MNKIFITILISISLTGNIYLSYLFIKAYVAPALLKHKIFAEKRKALEKGQRPFFFEKGKVQIFAHTEEQAKAKYRELKKIRKQQSKKPA